MDHQTPPGAAGAATPESTLAGVATGDRGAAPPPPAPAAPPATPPAAAAPDKADVIEIPKAAFKERLDREVAKRLEAYGIKSLDDIDKLAEREAEAKRAQMSELERVQAEARTAIERATKAEAERDTERFNAELHRACSETGVKNATYARFLVAEARKADPEASVLDVLNKSLADESTKAALGVAVAAPQAVAPNTVPAGQPPKPANANGAQIDVSKMSRDEWNAYKRQHNFT